MYTARVITVLLTNVLWLGYFIHNLKKGCLMSRQLGKMKHSQQAMAEFNFYFTKRIKYF